MMDSKKGKLYATNVTFAPPPLSLIQTTKARLDSTSSGDNQPLIGKHSNFRQNSLGLVSQTSITGQQRESLTGREGFLSQNHGIVKCLFQTRWKVLSYLQIVFGLVLMGVGAFSHYPIFTCGMNLVRPEVDYLWFGLWIGFLNLVCGLCGLAASKCGLNDGSLHRTLRRSYFILNCSFLPFVNGIGLTNFGITLSKYHLICNPSWNERFTTIMAFVQLCVLTICTILNVLGIIYQVVATIKCKCWICSPKNRGTVSCGGA